MAKYSVSFVATNGLMLNESIAIVPFLIDANVNAIEAEIATNLVLGNALSTRKRMVSEIRKRFKAIPLAAWEAFLDAERAEKMVILYYACLRAYQILQDFHIDIVLDKWNRYDRPISKIDFMNFLFSASSQHEEIDNWKESTHNGAANAALKMLKEAGLIGEDGLRPAYIADSFWKLFIVIGEPWFLEAMFVDEDDLLI